jgi:VWFA-related protein
MLERAGWAQTAITASLNERAKVRGTWKVNILAIVRDGKNQIVQGLTKDDFSLQDDGQPREIQYYGLDPSLPLNIGIVFDVTWYTSPHQKEERAAAREFLARVLREQDQAFVVSFAKGVALDQPLTSSRGDVDRAIASLKWGAGPFQTTTRGDVLNAGGQSRVGIPEPPPQRQGQVTTMSALVATKLFDAIGLSSDKVLRSQPGRKALIVLSNGFDADSAYPVDGAIEAAQRAEASVYTLALTGEAQGNVKMDRALGRVPNQWKVIPEETGGRHFAYDRKPLANAFGAIEDELRNQYSLGFELQDPAVGFHNVRVTTKQRDYKVQARTRYYVGE